MNFQEKLDRLNIQPVTDEVYKKELAQWDLLGSDPSHLKYFKDYGNDFMFYSEAYIRETPYVVLKERAETWNRHFNPNWLDRIKNKIDSWKFRMYCRKIQWFGEEE